MAAASACFQCGRLQVTIEYDGIGYDTWNDVLEGVIGDRFQIGAFSYNGKVTDDFWRTLELVASEEPLCAYQIAKTTGLSRNYVEFMLYVICNNHQATYGSSPRCCWLTEKGRQTFKELCVIREHLE